VNAEVGTSNFSDPPRFREHGVKLCKELLGVGVGGNASRKAFRILFKQCLPLRFRSKRSITSGLILSGSSYLAPLCVIILLLLASRILRQHPLPSCALPVISRHAVSAAGPPWMGRRVNGRNSHPRVSAGTLQDPLIESPVDHVATSKRNSRPTNNRVPHNLLGHWTVPGLLEVLKPAAHFPSLPNYDYGILTYASVVARSTLGETLPFASARSRFSPLS